MNGLGICYLGTTIYGMIAGYSNFEGDSRRPSCWASPTNRRTTDRLHGSVVHYEIPTIRRDRPELWAEPKSRADQASAGERAACLAEFSRSAVMCGQPHLEFYFALLKGSLTAVGACGA